MSQLITMDIWDTQLTPGCPGTSQQGSNAITGHNGMEEQQPPFSQKQPRNKREKGGSPRAPLGTPQDESAFSPNTQREYWAAGWTSRQHGPSWKSPGIAYMLAPTLPTHHVQGSFRSAKLHDVSLLNLQRVHPSPCWETGPEVVGEPSRWG